MNVRIVLLLVVAVGGCSDNPVVVGDLDGPRFEQFPAWPRDCDVPGCSCWYTPNELGDVGIECRVDLGTVEI